MQKFSQDYLAVLKTEAVIWCHANANAFLYGIIRLNTKGAFKAPPVF
jgi:hypothetical protein